MPCSLALSTLERLQPNKVRALEWRLYKCIKEEVDVSEQAGKAYITSRRLVPPCMPQFDCANMLETLLSVQTGRGLRTILQTFRQWTSSTRTCCNTTTAIIVKATRPILRRWPVKVKTLVPSLSFPDSYKKDEGSQPKKSPITNSMSTSTSHRLSYHL